MGKTKYNEANVKEILNELGYNILEYNSTKDIVVDDKNGYKYKANIHCIVSGKRPHMFMYNPFATENFKRYMEINHPNYIWLDKEYKGSKTKMRFMCKFHPEKGEQINFPDNIIHSHHLCKYCAYERMRDERVIQKEKLEQYCADKNVEYVGQYTKDHETYVIYQCEEHRKNGKQEMSLSHFKASARPCRFCSESSGEIKVSNYLIRNNITFSKEKRFDDCKDVRKLRFDFYLEDLNTIIEYDGKQHFYPVTFWNGADATSMLKKNQSRDKMKDDYCKSHGIRLIRIPYTQYNNIEKILDRELKYN